MYIDNNRKIVECCKCSKKIKVLFHNLGGFSCDCGYFFEYEKIETKEEK